MHVFFLILSISVCLWENKLKRGSGLDLLKTFNNLYKPEKRGGGALVMVMYKSGEKGAKSTALIGKKNY